MATSKLQNSEFDEIDYITYFISIISLAFSFFLIYIIKNTKELNANITNQFIVLLTISEIINNITQFSSLFATLLEKQNDKEDESLRVCFIQIYCNLFSNIMTLLSSLLISLHLLDAFYRNNSFFSTKKVLNIAKAVTVYLSLVVSLVFFIIHMEEYQNAEEIIYKRVISCWISGELDYFLIGIYVILIIFICVISYLIGTVVKAYRKELKESQGKTGVKDEKYDKVIIIQRMLFTYPFVTMLLYTVISVSRILTYVSLNHINKDNSVLLSISSWLFAIATNLRGFVFASVYLFMEKKFKERFVFYLCGGGCKGIKEEEKDSSNHLQMIEQAEIESEIDCDGDLY